MAEKIGDMNKAKKPIVVSADCSFTLINHPVSTFNAKKRKACL